MTATHRLVAIVVVWAIVFNFLFIFLCDPIAQQWTVERVGHCMDQILLLKCLIMVYNTNYLPQKIADPKIRPTW